MNRKKFTRAAKIATASLVAFTMTTSPVFAATGDLWKGTTNKGSVAQMILGGSAGRLDFATSMDQYTYEVDGVGYAVGEVDTMFKANPTLSTAEVQAKVKAELTGTPVSDELVVESVSAITSEINNVAGEQLDFEVVTNKGVKTVEDLEELEEAGYTIIFEATVATGVTAEGVVAGNAVATPFEYRVVISHDDLEEPIVSELQEVKVLNFAAVTTEITKVELAIDDANDDIIISSGKVVIGEPVIFVTGEGTLKNGQKDQDILASFTYKSSDITKAVVNAAGVITPISAGNVTITVKAGDVSKDILLTVATEARAAKNATFNKEAVRVINGGSQAVVATIVDQYGDPVKGHATGAVDVKNAKNETILTALTANTDEEGKATITFTGHLTNLGKGTIELKSGTIVLGTLPVEVGTGTEVAYRTLEIASGSKSDDYELDVYTGVEDDSSVTVVWNKYNDSNILIGAENDAKYSVASSKSSVASVTNDDLDTTGTIEVTAATAGTTTITIKEGAITRASFDVTVVDTTPAAASIALANGVTKIEINNDKNALTFTDIAANFVVKNQFGEEFVPANNLVTFFTDNAALLDTTTVNTIDATVSKGAGTANLIVKVNGHVISVPVVIVDVTEPAQADVSKLTVNDAGVTGTAGAVEGGATVEIYAENESAANGDDPIATVSAAADGSFAKEALADGTYDIYVVDAAGNVSVLLQVEVTGN